MFYGQKIGKTFYKMEKSPRPFSSTLSCRSPLLCHSLSHTHRSFLSFLFTKVVSKEVGSQLQWRSFDLHYSHLAATLISICSNLATAWVFRSRIETGFFPPDLGFQNDLWIVVVAGFMGCSEGLAVFFFFFPLICGFGWLEWRWVGLCRTGGGCLDLGGGWSGGGFVCAELGMVVRIWWVVRFMRVFSF